MGNLDILRWDQPIIKTDTRTLTKRDVFNYYADPKIRSKLLSQLQGNPVLTVQSLSPDRQIYRRNLTKDNPIRIDTATRDEKNPNDLRWFTERRFTEFHPVIQNTTDKIWVDIDPGGTQSPDDLKPVVRQVNNLVSKLPEVKNTEIAYSGGRGYYVTGLLKSKIDTDEIRKRLNVNLRSLTRKNKELTLRPPRQDQIRLDTSTLHDTGSIRALYSLNSTTGLASVPVTEDELDSFNPEIDADPLKLVTKTYMPKRLGKEFAPGIPQQKITNPIPQIKDKHWTISVQEHDAQKAGKHWDLRLVDPTTGYAHSWAVPKAKLPQMGDKPLLAIQTPTHSAHYALTFGEYKPKEITKGYGKGTVAIKIKEPVKILSSGPDTVKFERDSNENAQERYSLFRTKDNTWLIRNITRNKEASVRKNAYIEGYNSVFEKLGMRTSHMSSLPLQNNDESMPAGTLENLLSELPPPPKRMLNKRRPSPPYNTRLNQPSSWNSPMEISPYMAVGPSPILGYW